MARAKKKHKQQPVVPWVILGLLVVLGLWYAAQTPPKAPSANVTITGVAMGDLVSLNFALVLTNGSVVDTNNETLARAFNITNYVQGPFRFLVGESGKIKGFDEAMLGMTLGEPQTKIIQPTEQVLQYVINKTRRISRNQPISRLQPIPFKAYDTYFKRKPVINDVVYNPEFAWPFKVLNITERHVITDPLVEEGKSYQLPGFEWKSTLLVKTHNDLLFRHNPKDGQIITTKLGPAIVHSGQGIINITYLAQVNDIVKYEEPLAAPGVVFSVVPYDFRVVEVTDTTLTIRRVNYLPQETLVLTVELLEWEPDVDLARREKNKSSLV